VILFLRFVNIGFFSDIFFSVFCFVSIIAHQSLLVLALCIHLFVSKLSVYEYPLQRV